MTQSQKVPIRSRETRLKYRTIPLHCQPSLSVLGLALLSELLTKALALPPRIRRIPDSTALPLRPARFQRQTVSLADYEYLVQLPSRFGPLAD
jgi:hypothetical protein